MSKQKKSKPLLMNAPTLCIQTSSLREWEANYGLKFHESSGRDIEDLLNPIISDIVRKRNERTLTNAINGYAAALREALAEARAGGYAVYAVRALEPVYERLLAYDPAADSGGRTKMNCYMRQLFSGLEKVWYDAGGALITLSKGSVSTRSRTVEKQTRESKFAEFVGAVLSLVPSAVIISRKPESAYDAYRQSKQPKHPREKKCAIPDRWIVRHSQMDGSIVIMSMQLKAVSTAP